MLLRSFVLVLCVALSMPATASSALDCSGRGEAHFDPLVMSLMQWIADNSR